MSFASPPVDGTFTAVSYPSSPESARSPPLRPAQPATPNYRTAFLRDPFEDLRGNAGEDKIIQEALQNAQTNADVTQVSNTQPRQDAVKETLGRFAPGRRSSSTPEANSTTAPAVASQRQSMDVEAFTRLLLTGDSNKGDVGTRQSVSTLADNASSTDTNSVSQSSLFDTPGQLAEATPRSSHDNDRTTNEGIAKAPPPAPAPRRGKSVKVKDQIRKSDEDVKEPSRPPLRAALTPPTPPVARRSSQTIVTTNDEDKVQKQTETEARTESETASPKLAPPPPPPIRRQHSVSQRRPSNDLTPTPEEPGQLPATTSSRRSSADRPPAPPSRNSSASIKRQSMVAMQPPPVPPTRRGRDSSRNSMDSFRPSLASIIGNDDTQDNPLPESAVKGARNLTPSSADSILAELANLQKEVDAARRTA